MHLRRAIAVLAAFGVLAATPPARAFVLHPAVTVRGSSVAFYAGHLVLDVTGDATLDDGTLHVRADRIVLDLTNDRYVAAGNVRFTGASGENASGGDALGVDLATHKGLLVALTPAPASFQIDGSSVSPATAESGTEEPLGLPDLQGEIPFANAAKAVAHLGADVRLTSAHVLVPGGKDVPLPSYVYTFSSDPGYSASNVANSGEEVPIYFGSTRSSVDGAHFEYNPVTKVGLGLDHRIVDGNKAYDLFSVSPVNGPFKTANFTWFEQVNSHTSQTLTAGSSTGSGSAWNYSVSDGIHRSYLELFGSTSRGSNVATFIWQGQYEPLGTGWVGDLFEFHLRSEYGRSQAYSGGEAPLFHSTLETGIISLPMALDTATSFLVSADWRQTYDNFPHRQFAADYGAQLQHRWNSYVTTAISDDEVPLVDYYPAIDEGFRQYVSRQTGQLSYNHGEALTYTLVVEHQAGASFPSFGPFVQPWTAALDVRFRVNPSLSIDLNRSYGFGYFGQRFSSLGFQILP